MTEQFQKLLQFSTEITGVVLKSWDAADLVLLTTFVLVVVEMIWGCLSIYPFFCLGILTDAGYISFISSLQCFMRSVLILGNPSSIELLKSSV